MTFSRQYAFTLIELLVVMAIISIAATLVGPLAVNQYEKSQQTAEREALLRLLDHYTFNAYSHNQDYTLTTTANKIFINKGQPPLDKSVQALGGAGSGEVWEFEFLRFPQQQIDLNRHGFWQPNVIVWREGERELSTELNMQLVEQGVSDAPLD